MSLSDRLAAAAAERRGDEQRHSTPPPAPPPRSAPMAPEVAITGDVAEVPGGLPLPCHNCGGNGFLDRIDLPNHLQYEHCRDCGSHWARPA